MERDFQITVWGATGFTGQIVTEYLHKNYGNEIRWAIAGRSIEKLQSVKNKLQLNDSVECLVGDSFDEKSLQTITSRTDVIISTVGPYALYGKAMVNVCVESKTDYCDLTGEIPFVKNSIDAFHEKAKANEVKIVHSCGYDSIPSALDGPSPGLGNTVFCRRDRVHDIDISLIKMPIATMSIAPRNLPFIP